MPEPVITPFYMASLKGLRVAAGLLGSREALSFAPALLLEARWLGVLRACGLLYCVDYVGGYLRLLRLPTVVLETLARSEKSLVLSGDILEKRVVFMVGPEPLKPNCMFVLSLTPKF